MNIKKIIKKILFTDKGKPKVAMIGGLIIGLILVFFGVIAFSIMQFKSSDEPIKEEKVVIEKDSYDNSVGTMSLENNHKIKGLAKNELDKMIKEKEKFNLEDLQLALITIVEQKLDIMYIKDVFQKKNLSENEVEELLKSLDFSQGQTAKSYYYDENAKLKINYNYFFQYLRANVNAQEDKEEVSPAPKDLLKQKEIIDKRVGYVENYYKEKIRQLKNGEITQQQFEEIVYRNSPQKNHYKEKIQQFKDGEITQKELEESITNDNPNKPNNLSDGEKHYKEKIQQFKDGEISKKELEESINNNNPNNQSKTKQRNHYKEKIQQFKDGKISQEELEESINNDNQPNNLSDSEKYFKDKIRQLKDDEISQSELKRTVADPSNTEKNNNDDSSNSNNKNDNTKNNTSNNSNDDDYYKERIQQFKDGEISQRELEESIADDNPNKPNDGDKSYYKEKIRQLKDGEINQNELKEVVSTNDGNNKNENNSSNDNNADYYKEKIRQMKEGEITPQELAKSLEKNNYDTNNNSNNDFNKQNNNNNNNNDNDNDNNSNRNYNNQPTNQNYNNTSNNAPQEEKEEYSYSYGSDYSGYDETNDYNSTTNNQGKQQKTQTTSSIIDNQSITNSDVIIDNPSEKNKMVDIKAGIKPGTMIKGRLLTGMMSSTRKRKTYIKITENVRYNKKIVIPRGSKIQGEYTTDYQNRKIFVETKKLIIGDKVININGELLKPNGDRGFASKVIDHSKISIWKQFLLGGISMYINSMKDVIPVTDDGRVKTVEDNTIKNQTLNSANEGLNQVGQQMQNEAKQKKVLITVKNKSDVNIVINKKIPLEHLNR